MKLGEDMYIFDSNTYEIDPLIYIGKNQNII